MKEKLMLQLEPLIQRFEQEWLPRYQQLDNREQRLVLVAAVLLPVMIVLFGLILPLKDRHDALRENLVAVQSQAVEAEKMARYLVEHAAERKGGGGCGKYDDYSGTPCPTDGGEALYDPDHTTDNTRRRREAADDQYEKRTL